MSTVILLVVALLLAFVDGCFAKPEAKPGYTIIEEHPRLYVTEERLEGIRKRCEEKRGAQARYYSILKGYADTFTPGKSESSAYHCIYLAFVYVVGEVPGYDYSRRSIKEYGRLGAAMLTQLHPPLNDFSYFLRHTPLLIACYDWLFPAMTPAERATIFKNFTARVRQDACRAENAYRQPF